MLKTIISSVAVLVLVSPLAAFAAVAEITGTSVTATSDAGSFVSPGGTTFVTSGTTQIFNIGAFGGFKVTNVSVNGNAQGAVGSISITGTSDVDAFMEDPSFDTNDTTTATISVTSVPTGGNLLFCSGPEAPGYTVGKVGGGCGAPTTYVPFNGTTCPFNQGCMIPNALFQSVVK